MTRSVTDILADTDDLSNAVLLDNKNTGIPADIETDTGETSFDETEQPYEALDVEDEVTEPVITTDSFLEELQNLPENKRRKYLNPDGSPKSPAELLKMHLNAEKLIGASPEKKAEYLQSQGGEELPETEIDSVIETVESSYDYVIPNTEEERVQKTKLAMNKLRELNISIGLGLEFKNGVVKGFDPENDTHKEAWEIAIESAEDIYSITKEQTRSQIKPFEESQKRTAYQSVIQKVISEFDIKGVTTKEVTDLFVQDLDLEGWKQLSPEDRKRYIRTEAEAMAYRKIKATANTKVKVSAPAENPVTLKSGNNVKAVSNTALTPMQKSEYDKHCKIMQQQGFLTDSMKATLLKEVRQNYPEGGK